MNEPCDCNGAAGVDTKPAAISNRPGLPAIDYRIGTHGTFLAAMKRRLSSYVPLADGPRVAPLAGLTTRDSDDPAIALLDAAALLADVVTFYQERIANEGYLRTATEPASIAALAALVGYTGRPGVASSVFLAYGVQAASPDEVVPVPAGCRVQSVPDPGSMPQTFETAEALQARPAWNRLPLRATQPQRPAPDSEVLFFKGVATNLKPNDPLLLMRGSDVVPGALPRVESVEPDFSTNVTKVRLQRPTKPTSLPKVTEQVSVSVIGSQVLESLRLAPASHPASAVDLKQDVRGALTMNNDAAVQMLLAFQPMMASSLYTAIGNARVAQRPDVSVLTFRTRAAVYGHNAPLRPVVDDAGKAVGYGEWTLQKPTPTGTQREPFRIDVRVSESKDVVFEITVSIGTNGSNVMGNLMASKLSLTLDDPSARETITIKVDRGDNEVLQVLYFSFERRNAAIALTNIHLDSEQDIVATTEGCDPVKVTRIPGSRSTGFARRVLGRADERPFITVEGSVLALLSATAEAAESANVVSIDVPDERFVPGGWVWVARPDVDPAKPIVARLLGATTASRADYGLTGRASNLNLDRPWLGPDAKTKAPTRAVADEDFATVVRGTTVYAETQALELADAPDDAAIEGNSLALQGVFGGLAPGRWLIIEGERVDVPQTSGVRAAELVMLAGSRHYVDSSLPGDTVSTVLTLAAPLAYRYARGSVIVYGNVVHATQGESRSEVLGSGDGNQPTAQFVLKQGPLTYASSATASGVRSSLDVRVNDVTWQEVASFDTLGPTDRGYVTRPIPDGKTLIAFGNGLHGARPPTGANNIQAYYRTGLGIGGNVAAGKVNQLTSRPLGVVSVVNPLPADGGADPEGIEAARRNVPLAVGALDRLVSTPDYADFARTFAGIGKATASLLPIGHRLTLCLSVGGADESPLSASSDLCWNLQQAALQQGDPYQPLVVLPGEAVLLVIVANVRVADDHHWDSVEPAIRAALLSTLGYDQRGFGEDVVLSEVVSAIQGVEGVEYVDVDRLDATTLATRESDLARLSGPKLRRPGLPARVRALEARPSPTAVGGVLPAQLVYLSARLPSLVSLTEITS
ncbi:MAG: putative baseplate assembly protein [Leptothrix sp. (in: b-proteobacteria)]